MSANGGEQRVSGAAEAQRGSRPEEATARRAGCGHARSKQQQLAGARPNAQGHGEGVDRGERTRARTHPGVTRTCARVRAGTQGPQRARARATATLDVYGNGKRRRGKRGSTGRGPHGRCRCTGGEARRGRSGRRSGRHEEWTRSGEEVRVDGRRPRCPRAWSQQDGGARGRGRARVRGRARGLGVGHIGAGEPQDRRHGDGRRSDARARRRVREEGDERLVG